MEPFGFRPNVQLITKCSNPRLIDTIILKQKQVYELQEKAAF